MRRWRKSVTTIRWTSSSGCPTRRRVHQRARHPWSPARAVPTIFWPHRSMSAVLWGFSPIDSTTDAKSKESTQSTSTSAISSRGRTNRRVEATSLWTLYGREPNSIYVVDNRSSVPAGTEPGVRLVNGSQLPAGGLTVATPDPLYVKGDFNVKDSSGTSSGSDTTHTKPSSLVADAITVLSNGWLDSANAAGNFHDASATTVNAAFLAGIVQTSANSYSGGVENFPRFLENWSGRSLTYNGSMGVMVYSKNAVGPWKGPGTYYNPPGAHWGFGNKFLNPHKQ